MKSENLDEKIKYKKEKIVKEIIKYRAITDDEPISVSKYDLRYYTSNMSRIWKNINIQDVKVNGKIDGFKIISINKNSVFGKLGLKKGDIIKAINNQKLKSYSDAFKVYKKINKLDDLQITILRNNIERDLEYEIYENN